MPFSIAKKVCTLERCTKTGLVLRKESMIDPLIFFTAKSIHMEVSAQTSELGQIQDWKVEVNSSRDTIRSMQNRLELLSSKKSDEDSLAQIEHFQNQFIRQLEVSDEMFHDLKQCAKKISNNGQLAVLHDDRPVDDCATMEDRMQTFRKLYNELQEEFNAFSAFS